MPLKGIISDKREGILFTVNSF